MSQNPTDYIDAKAAIQKIVEEASVHEDRVNSAIDNLSRAYNDLAGMATRWAAAVTYIEDQATANPDDALWQKLKSEKDRIVTDFAAKRDRAQAIRDAANGAA